MTEWASQLRKLYPHITKNMIVRALTTASASFGTNIAGLRQHIYDRKIPLDKLSLQEPEHFIVDMSPDPVTYEGDAMVVGDVQIPTTDWFFATRVGMVAKRYLPRPRRLIVAGDFWNFDAYSSYVQISKTPDAKQEFKAGWKLMSEWLKVFDTIEMIMGNHDIRLLRYLKGSLDPDDMLAMMTRGRDEGRISITIRDMCYLQTSRGKWAIIHGANYGRAQLSNANKLAHKFLCNIIAHHEHHLAHGWDEYKNFQLVNNGGLFDVKKMKYVQERTSTIPNMARGFTMIKDGYAHVYGDDDYTDWGKVLTGRVA